MCDINKNIIKNNSQIKVVLIEKRNNFYPYRKIDSVKYTWSEGHHPKSCIGLCELRIGVFSEYCSGCGYDTY